MFPAFFTPLVTKVLFYVVGGLVATGVVFGAYYSWKKSVTAEANQALVIRQLEQALKDVQDLNHKMQNLQKKAAEMVEEIQKQEEEREKADRELLDKIDGAEDRPASDVLKNTVKNLGGR